MHFSRYRKNFFPRLPSDLSENLFVTCSVGPWQLLDEGWRVGGGCLSPFVVPQSISKRGEIFLHTPPPLLILSTALACSYCTYANTAMSAIEASSAIYSGSLTTLITAAADFRRLKYTLAHTCTHTQRTHAHTRSIFFFPGI